MYLYYDKTRILKTAISHGEPIRQSSDVNIFICLELDFFKNDEIALKSHIEASVTYENGKLGANGVISETPRKLPFKKINSSEMTYHLQNNRRYWIYQLKFDSEQISVYPGKIYFNVNLITEEEIKTFGNAELYVEARTGLPEYDNSIKINQYKEIIRRISEIENKISNVGNFELLKMDDGLYLNSKENLDIVENDELIEKLDETISILNNIVNNL